jgi:hypothetical protein
MAKANNTVPHSQIKALGQAIGTYDFEHEDAVLHQYADTCGRTLRKRLKDLSAACRRAHELTPHRRAA